MIESNVLNWLTLRSVPGLGPVLVKRLIDAFGTPESVLNASFDSLVRFEGIGPSLARSILSTRLGDWAKKEFQKLRETGTHLITLTDPGYPALLREIFDPPPFLYVRGEIPSDVPFLAVVGSRRATTYGRLVTEKICRQLVGAGFCVVSGLARGIDGFAHLGALQGNGKTVGVLGSGIDVPYPMEHRGLMARISKSGAVVSEYPLGTGPDTKHFPQRNRIISGLALGTLVVEAAKESGSLITARFALEQGREVFAVPGNMGSRMSEGTNRLIQSGAKLVLGIQDILDEMRPDFRSEETVSEKSDGSGTGSKTRPLLGEEEGVLYDLVGADPVHIDELCLRSRLPTQKVSSLLLALELKGAVQQTAGHYYLRTL